MAKSFVVINDPVHRLLRSITRRVPLCSQADSGTVPNVEYRFRPEDLPEAYYSLAVYHGITGIPLREVNFNSWRVSSTDKPWVPARANFFDAARLDRRCCRDLRLKVRKDGPGLLSGEILTYGTGTLRARNDAPQMPLHSEIWRLYGRLNPRCEEVFAHIRALTWDSLPLLQTHEKETFDSTNVVYGDVFGEIEQLWERRADTAFLDQVAHCLQRMKPHPQLAAYLYPPLNVDEVLQCHRRAQGVWKTPPSSGRALLRRIEFVLNNSVVDNTPPTLFRRQGPQTGVATSPQAGSDGPWRQDSTGYDGWLGA